MSWEAATVERSLPGLERHSLDDVRRAAEFMPGDPSRRPKLIEERDARMAVCESECEHFVGYDQEWPCNISDPKCIPCGAHTPERKLLTLAMIGLPPDRFRSKDASQCRWVELGIERKT